MTSLPDIVRLLLDSRAGGAEPSTTLWPSLTPADAYAVQDGVLAALAPVGGWKVGAARRDAVPQCAPLPLRGILQSGAALPAARTASRLLELEVALRLGTDLHVATDQPTPAELAACFDAVMPAIEIVESRLAEGQNSPVMAKLADLQSHGALVVGAPATMSPIALDLRLVQTTLWLGADRAVATTGGNPAQDVWWLLGWLARHCTERGTPLRKGQIVTTGSCIGMVSALPGHEVRGEVLGIGEVRCVI
ncbi:fumarylacetoacetate hydrolase family protein [soil metagenome]